MRIRTSRADDRARLVEVWRAAVQSSHHFLTSTQIDAYEPLVTAALQDLLHIQVAVDEHDRALGFVLSSGDDLHMLFVDPAAQGAGVGSHLLETAVIGRSRVRLDVNEQNATARAFYRARGFAVVGRSDRDGQGKPFPLLHLERHAPPG